ncbi:MAG TPA: TatD family hydrolase [Acidisarcina sp.]|nr:TatD family hydrolase [Acidisarcina sp.]
MLVDSHAHLDSSRYEEDREAMLRRAWETGVRTILSIGIGDGPSTMHRALELSRQYAGHAEMPRILATAGIHPHEASLADEDALSALDQLLQQPEVIACGEIGLDYFYDHSPRDQQKRVFATQMEIAAARKRPIIIHCRPSENSSDAWDDTLAMISEQWAATGLGGLLHCFTGNWDHASHALDYGFLLSFAGNVTFPKAQPIRDVARKVPLGSMLVETDAPFLAPVPNRGKRNEPAWVREVAAKIAEVQEIDLETVASSTTENFHRFFGLTPGLV